MNELKKRLKLLELKTRIVKDRYAEHYRLYLYNGDYESVKQVMSLLEELNLWHKDFIPNYGYTSSSKATGYVWVKF